MIRTIQTVYLIAFFASLIAMADCKGDNDLATPTPDETILEIDADSSELTFYGDTNLIAFFPCTHLNFDFDDDGNWDGTITCDCELYMSGEVTRQEFLGQVKTILRKRGRRGMDPMWRKSQPRDWHVADCGRLDTIILEAPILGRL